MKIKLKIRPILFVAVALLTAVSIYWISVKRNEIEIIPPSLTIKADIERDIVYKKDLTLDIFKPIVNKKSKLPVIVFIHGGGWNLGDKTAIETYYRQYLLQELLSDGICVVSINYTLVDGNNHLSTSLSDCKDAIRWIRKNSAHYSFDTDNIGVWGASAGGNLALLTAYLPDSLSVGEQSLQKYPASVKFVIDNFGPTDLNQLLRTDANSFTLRIFKAFSETKYDRRNKKIWELTGYDIEKDKENAIASCAIYSPINYIDNNTIPTLVLHGTADETVNLIQSELLDEKLNNFGTGHQFTIYKGLTHGFKNATTSQIREITGNTLQFVKQQIK